MEKTKNKGLSVLRRWTQCSPRRHAAALLLALTAMFAYAPQAHAEEVGIEAPEVVETWNLTPTISGTSHIAFSFIWFNSKGDNSFFDTSKGDVCLYIDGENVMSLTDLVNQELSGWTCRMFNAKCPKGNSKWTGYEDNARDLVNDHKGQFICKGSFTGKRFRTGTISLANPCKHGNTWAYKISVDLCLEEYHNGVSHDIRIVGPWVYRNNWSDYRSKNYTYDDTPCKVTVNAPSFTAPTLNIVRTGSMKATMTASNMKKYTYQATSSSTPITFYYTAAAWTKAPADHTKGNEYWGWGNQTGSDCRLLWTDITDGSATKSFDLALTSNYEPQSIYPRMRAWSGDYEMVPGGTSTFIKQTTGYNHDYNVVKLPGYPRPSNLTVIPNMWSRDVTITWVPEVSDAKNYNAEGKWVVFRKKTGQSDTQVFYGETDYVTYVPGKEVKLEPSFRNTTTCPLPEYDQQYTYTVVFQPKEWGLGTGHLDHEDRAVGLSSYTRNTIVRENPFKSITASNDRSDGIITVKWTFNNFEDATESNKYAIKISRREKAAPGKPENPWSVVHTQYVTSKNEKEGTFDNTGISSSRITYEYKADVEAMSTSFSTWPKYATEGRLDGSSKVVSVSASRGAYSGVVRISWTAKQVGSETTYFVVKRRLLGSDADYQEIYTTSGVATNYSYEDVTAQPGCYYQYKVDCYNVEGSTMYPGTGAFTDGFALATGVVSGRIAYGGGTAVEGVKVSLVNISSADNPQSQFRSMSFTESGTGAGLLWKADNDKIKQLFQGKSWTVQMNIYPDSTKMNVDAREYMLWSSSSTAATRLRYNKTKNTYTVVGYLAGSTKVSDLTDIPANQWTNISMFVNTANGTWGVAAVYPDGHMRYYSYSFSLNGIKSASGTGIGIGNSESMASANSFAGNIDDFRFFTRTLSEDDIRKNYNHRLSGSEEGLAIYYPMDEGLQNQSMVYDYSRTGGISNGRHATVAPNTFSSTIVPSENQFSICGYTDKNGNYSVSGIPFSGDGTSYSIIPTMGGHDFTPTEANRYISAQSLVHNGVDFTDVSSFPVSGVVLYENTTIPVEGAYLYIDGVIASKDGNMIATDEYGEYTIDVPIGDHYIEVKKEGHTFLNNGRYPADPNGTGERHTFESEVKNLKFTDLTTAVVAGRVAGGDVEFAKPLGFGVGKANIGAATITLSYTNDLYEINTTDGVREYASVGGLGSASTAANSKRVVIKTSADNGEFAVKLPPLIYNVESITIDDNPEITGLDKPVLDATNILRLNKDSVEVDGKYQYFEYVTAARIEYKAPSQMDVEEWSNGAFGLDSIDVADMVGNVERVPLYTVDEETGDVNYTFGHPVYEQLNKHKYKIHAYEKYVNKTTGEEDIVPLSGVSVTVKNQFSTAAAVYYETGEVCESESKDIEFELDSLGMATYEFSVGLPNIQAPYTRGISITYGNDYIKWPGSDTFQAIVLGSLTKGNDFITDGPDALLMVLRDPPGTSSNTTWSKGTSNTKTKSVTVSLNSEVELNVETSLGGTIKLANGIGVAKIDEIKATADLNVGTDINVSYTNNHTFTVTTTTTKEISTSDSPDFVGSVGDVFIGASKNRIYGACTDVKVVKNELTGDYELSSEDAFKIGEEFATQFSYTQNYIENVLLESFASKRDALIVQVADVNAVPAPIAGMDPIYVTTLSPDDERFGTANDDEDAWGDEAKEFELKISGGKAYVEGPSYTMIMPVDYEDRILQDKVQYYNTQISIWQKHLADNEKSKVTAIKNRDKYLEANYSFDAGSTVTETTETSDLTSVTNGGSEEIKLIFGTKAGFTLNDVGVKIEVKETNSEKVEGSDTEEETKTESFSYTLKEDGDDDYLSVDVLRAPDNFGPIFYTRGGATCAPYEDVVVTKYYQPGTIISQKTLQIEKPELEVIDQVVRGVPAGKDAVFRIKIRNLSETGEDCYYGLWVNPETNPNGAQIFMDGINITPGVDILVPAGEEMIKTLFLRQTNKDILDYTGISLSLYSTSQPDDTGVFPGIYSDAEIEVHFQASCSDVDLASSATIVNTETQGNLELYMSGYDYNMALFQTLRLEYKGEHDADFKVLKSFTKDEAKILADPSLGLIVPLAGAQKLTYSLDLKSSSWQDQTYVFRAVTAGMVNGQEVTTMSDEIKVIRDVTRPQLIATPTPVSGVLSSGDDISITFNEDIRWQQLTEMSNFSVVGAMNDTEVAHDVALSLGGAEMAKTNTTIDLADKSFAASFWVNYSTDGQMLYHGTSSDAFTVSTVDGKVAVSFGGQTYTSSATLPKNKWVYVNISLDCSGAEPLLNVGYAQDASSVTLINNVNTVKYSGNGPLALGGTTFTGKVQELALWNTPRTLVEALSDKSVPKNQYTTGIMGYWKFNEGHGTVAEDDSRSRHITVPANAWWIDGVNYSVALDGQTALKASLGNIIAKNDESYLMECWFRADKSQNSAASIMTVDDSKIGLQLSSTGILQLVTNGTATDVSKSSLRDGQWHHLALNVLKSTNGSAIVYVDGQPLKQFAATAVPALQGAQLILGGKANGGLISYGNFLKGNIDEVRVWKGRRTAEVIKNNVYNCVEDDADGLVAYYSFEKTALDEYDQTVTSFSMNDRTGNSVDATLVNSIAGSVAVSASNTSKTVFPAIKAAPAKEKVAFNFVASERQVTLTLDENPYKIEGCVIYITARKITDLNGNSCEPITWSVYVQQNSLRWSESEVAVSKTGVEEVTFTVDIENQKGLIESYAITDLPSWLSVNSESGSIQPLGKKTLTFTVNPAVANGNYETTIYVVGSQNIPTPLTVTLSAESEAPNWKPAYGECTMNIIGQISVDGVYSSDTRDILAAFIDDKCVGVAKPTYYSKYDSYILLMDIYGNASDNNKPITYKLYDASTGTVYPSVAVSISAATKFAVDNFVGTFSKRIVFSPEDKIEQEIALAREGWKWFSLYVAPEDASPASIFANSSDALTLVTGNAQTAQNNAGRWIGNLQSLDNASMYKANAKQAFAQNVIGASVNPADITIQINKNWSWIGYPVAASNTLNEALASVSPEEDDIIKGQSGFAYYTGEEWVGSLKALVPGEGYYYYSNASVAKSFSFPMPSMSSRRAARQAVKEITVAEIPFRDNMTMIAVVKDGDRMVENAKVMVCAGNEVRGLSETPIRGKHFLTIGSNNRNELLDVVITTEDGTVRLAQSLVFAADAQLGSYIEPYVFDLSDATDIDDVTACGIKNITLYNINGIAVSSIDNPSSVALDEIKANAGVYVQKITYADGRVKMVKVSK